MAPLFDRKCWRLYIRKSKFVWNVSFFEDKSFLNHLSCEELKNSAFMLPLFIIKYNVFICFVIDQGVGGSSALKNISIGERFFSSILEKIEYRRSYRIIKNKVLPTIARITFLV